MKRIELAKKLAGLKELKKKIEEIRTGDISKFMEVGLLTPAEYEEWGKVAPVAYGEYHAGHAAEEAIQHVLPMDQYPKEYQRIIKRMEEIEPDLELTKDIWNTLSNMTPSAGNRYSSGTCLGEMLGVADVAQQMFTFLLTTTTEEAAEYDRLKESRERKTRDGSIVRRVNAAAWDKTNELRKVAGEKARAEYHAKHVTEIRRKQELDNLIEERRKMRMNALGQEIRDLLNSVMQDLSTDATTAGLLKVCGWVKESKICPQCNTGRLIVDRGQLEQGKVAMACTRCNYTEPVAAPTLDYEADISEAEKRMARLTD